MMLEVYNAWKEFRDNGVVRYALRDVSLRVDSGEIVVVIGPNGAGKSTLGNILIHDTVTQGTVLLGGLDVTRLPSHQRGGLFAKLTQNPSDNLSDSISIVEHFVLAKSRARRRSSWFGISKEIRSEASAKLAQLRSGLEARLDDSVTTLSGGERQLIALSLLTVSPPKVLFLDEPTSALDRSARLALHKAALELIGAHSVPTLWVTHDLDEALKVASRLVLMAEGSIAYEFSGDVLATMTRERLARLMSELVVARIVPKLDVGQN